MYCKQCGNEVAEGAKFCESCGTPIDQVEEAKRQTQQEQPTIVINNNQVEWTTHIKTSGWHLRSAYCLV